MGIFVPILLLLSGFLTTLLFEKSARKYVALTAAVLSIAEPFIHTLLPTLAFDFMWLLWPLLGGTIMWLVTLYMCRNQE